MGDENLEVKRSTKVVQIEKGDALVFGVEGPHFKHEEIEAVANFFSQLGIRVLFLNRSVSMVKVTEETRQALMDKAHDIAEADHGFVFIK